MIINMSNRTWSEDELKKINAAFDGSPPQDVLKWVVENFEISEYALASSFSECVLVDMLVRIKPDARIFYLDTGLLFDETREVIERVCCKYGISVEMFAPLLTLEEMDKKYGPELWKKNPDMCCEIRKLSVMKRALSGLKLWITGIRREEAASRKDAPVVGWDARFGLIKVNPLAAWTKKDVWDYIYKNDVPYNILLDQGYASIGCRPCTEPVKPGDDDRAGRWSGSTKVECGLHK